MMTQEIAFVERKSFKLSEKGQRILVLLADHYGISQTATLEVILREIAITKGLGQQAA